MKKSKFVSVAVLALVAPIVLAACGDDGGGSGGDTIKLMSIAPISTNLQNYPDAPAGAEAAVKAINKAGGVNGKKLEWSYCNTESDPNKATACARKAQAEGVVAVVGQHDAFSTVTLPVLEKAGIASVGFHSSGNPIDWNNPTSFPLEGGAPAAYAAVPNAAKQAGAKRVAVLYTDTPAAVAEAKMVEQATEREGLEFGGSFPIPATGVTDYSPYAQKIADADADAAVMIGSAAYTGPLVKATESLGLDPIWFQNAFTYAEAELEGLGSLADDFLVIGPFPTFRDTDVPAVKQYVEELDASGAKSDPVVRRSSGLNSWLSVYATVKVIEDMDGEINNETFFKALESHGDIDLFGLLTWNPSKLGSDNPDFPRFPAGAEQQILKLEDGQMVSADLDPVKDPLAGITSKN